MDYYARFSQKGKPFVALTGLTHREFKALLPSSRSCFLKQMRRYTLKGKKRSGQLRRRYVEYYNSPLQTMENKLMFILVYLRKGTTQDIFGAVFDMSQPVANKWIHILHPCLNQALADLGERSARRVAELHLSAKEGQVFFQDGTERPIERPKDPDLQRLFYSGKKKKHCIKNNVLVSQQAKILLLTPTCEGKKHDKKIADETGLVLPAGSSLYQALGFLVFSVLDVTMIQPIKKPCGKELTPEQKRKRPPDPQCARPRRT